MSPFMRRIASLESLKAEGTDPEFFREGELVEIPKSIAEVIESWCKEEGVANASLPSKRATTDEPLDVYYIPLATKSGQAQIKAMLKTIAQPFVDAMSAAAGAMKRKTVFAADGNRPVDEIVALGTLRNQLMVFAEKPPEAEGEDITLVIYV